MPLSKKRKKERRNKPREREPAPAAPAAPAPSAGGGLLTRMRGGIQGMAGTGARKPESLLSKIITWALVLAVAYFVARRFGIIP